MLSDEEERIWNDYKFHKEANQYAEILNKKMEEMADERKA